MKKVLIIFCLLLIANNNFAEENIVTENINENIQKPVEEELTDKTQNKPKSEKNKVIKTN